MLALASMVLVGCSGKKDAQTEVQTEPAVTETSETEAAPATEEKPLAETATGEVAVSALEAAEIFKAEYPEAILTSLTLDKENGRWEYDLDGHSEGKEYDMVIDANTKEVLVSRVENEDDRDDDQAIDVAGAIDVNKVFEIAQQEGLTKVDQMELDNENGKDYWKVEDEGDMELVLDAATGQVVSKDLDD